MAGGLAIVLSGGGAKGAFQVGVLDELVRRRGVRFDIVAGVSTGAIQALGLAQDDVPGLLDQWLAIRGNRDIYRERPLGPVGGVLGADALYDASPLRAKMRGFADQAKLRASGKRLLLGVVNLGTGAFRSIDERVPDIHNWVYASSAMPLFFDPLRTEAADGTVEQWVDGGVRNVTPLDAALELRPRAVLVVQASPPPRAGAPKRYRNLIKIGLRAVDILQSEVSANDVATAELINDLLKARDAQAAAMAAERIDPRTVERLLRPLDEQLARYRFAPILTIAPERELSETLDFDPAKIRGAIDAGRAAAAQAWTALGPLLR